MIHHNCIPAAVLALAIAACDDAPVANAGDDAGDGDADPAVGTNGAPIVRPPTPEFSPDHTKVSVHDDGSLEILAFDNRDQLVGVLLMDASAECLQIDASFGDGHVEGVLPSADMRFDPPPGLINSNQLLRLCGELEDYDNDIEISMWWGTDLADPCAATTRVATIFHLAQPALAEADTIRIDPQAGPTKRQCIVKFATAGTLCGFTALFPYHVVAAVACLKGVFDTWCDCGKYLPVEVC